MKGLFVFLYTEWLIVFRTMRRLGMLSFLVLCFLYVYFYVMTKIPFYWVLVIYMILIYTYHTRRHDIDFLYITFGKKYKKILFVQYVILALPFLIAGVVHNCWYATTLIMICFIAWLPNKRKRTMISFPYLLKGSYEFSCGFRKTSYMYILLLVISLIGAFAHNMNLIAACVVINTINIVFYYHLPLRREYFLNYNSVTYFLRLKNCMAVWNYTILQLPFSLILLLSSLGLNMGCILYLAGLILVLQALNLRILCGSNTFIQFCMECILIVMEGLVFAYGNFIFINITMLLLLFLASYVKLKKYIQ